MWLDTYLSNMSKAAGEGTTGADSSATWSEGLTQWSAAAGSVDDALPTRHASGGRAFGSQARETA